jgi:tetratricopeptide (TPR) repeat protein
VAESLGGPTAQALAKEIEGVGAYVSGDCPRALALLREACSLATAASLDSDVASCLNHLGLVADAAGEYAEAAGAYAQALRYYEASGHQASAARVMENLASVYLHQGDYARAEALAGRAEQEYVRLGEEGMALKAMSLRGKCLAQWGRHNDALRVLDEAVDRGREAWSQTPLVLADALLSKSYVLLDLNRLKESEEARVEAQRMYQAHGAVLPDRGSDAGLEDKLNDFSVAVESTVRRIDELQGAGMLVEAAREKMNLSHLYTHRLSAITSAGADADPGDVEHAAGLVPEALDLLEEATAVFAEHGALGLLLRARKSRAVLAAAVGQATGDADALEEVLRELSELLRVAEDRGEAALAISLRQNAAQLMAQFGRVAEAAECIGNVDLDGVEPGEEDLVLHTCLTLAHLSAQAGDTDSARRMFLQAIRAYETQEERVGDPDYAVSWGKGAAHRVFDEAIEYLVAIGDVAGAYELVDRAKARVFQKALFSSLGRPEDLA